MSNSDSFGLFSRDSLLSGDLISQHVNELQLNGEWVTFIVRDWDEKIDGESELRTRYFVEEIRGDSEEKYECERIIDYSGDVYTTIEDEDEFRVKGRYQSVHYGEGRVLDTLNIFRLCVGVSDSVRLGYCTFSGVGFLKVSILTGTAVKMSGSVLVAYLGDVVEGVSGHLLAGFSLDAAVSKRLYMGIYLEKVKHRRVKWRRYKASRAVLWNQEGSIKSCWLFR